MERGCYFFLTLPEALREPEDEPRDDELLLPEEELREELLMELLELEDEERTLAELLFDDELVDVPRIEDDGRE